MAYVWDIFRFVTFGVTLVLPSLFLKHVFFPRGGGYHPLWTWKWNPPDTCNQYQGRRQSKSLGGAKEPRGPGGSTPGGGPGGRAPWWGPGSKAPEAEAFLVLKSW